MVITSTPAMEDSAVTLSTLGALVWLGGRRPRINAAEVRDAIATKFVIDRNYIKVVPHYPEDFFVLFNHQHHRDLVTTAGWTSTPPNGGQRQTLSWWRRTTTFTCALKICRSMRGATRWQRKCSAPTHSCTSSTSPLSREKTPPPSTSGHGQPTPPPFPRSSG